MKARLYRLYRLREACSMIRKMSEEWHRHQRLAATLDARKEAPARLKALP